MPRHTFRSLRHRNYRLYFIGQLISLLGSWMQTTALVWLAYDITHQAQWSAFIMAAIIGPTFLLGAWAGSLADRFPKRRLIIFTQIGFCCTATLLTTIYYLNAVEPWILLVVMFAHGIVQAIDLPVRLAFVPDLVPREDLINTVALNSVQFNTARAIGPALAGLLLATVGPGPCFLINSCSYLAVLGALAAMRNLPLSATHASPSTDSIGGFTVLRRHRSLTMVILAAALTAIAGWPLLSLLPAYADRVLHADERAYSTLLSSVGMGALCAALTAASFGAEHRQKSLMCVGVILVTLALFGLTLFPQFWFAVVSCILFGYGMILFFATGQGAVQLGVQPAHRGKVMGIWAMAMAGGTPIGNLILGPAADAWGVTVVLLGQAILMAIVPIFLLWYHTSPKTAEAVMV